ncbi:MAG: hypothetical protein HC880_02995, partial [Bacteroidia bacterium]|nr:hypothetical protein [Bacteroidia bacterium]
SSVQSWGIKIDAVVVHPNSEEQWRKELAGQFPLTFIITTGPHPPAALEYLHQLGSTHVNRVAAFPSVAPTPPDGQEWVFFTPNVKISYIRRPHWKKWLSQGSILQLWMSDFEGKNLAGLPIAGFYQVLQDGWAEVNHPDGSFWLGEAFPEFEGVIARSKPGLPN